MRTLIEFYENDADKKAYWTERAAKAGEIQSIFLYYNF